MDHAGVGNAIDLEGGDKRGLARRPPLGDGADHEFRGNFQERAGHDRLATVDIDLDDALQVRIALHDEAQVIEAAFAISGSSLDLHGKRRAHVSQESVYGKGSLHGGRHQRRLHLRLDRLEAAPAPHAEAEQRKHNDEEAEEQHAAARPHRGQQFPRARGSTRRMGCLGPRPPRFVYHLTPTQMSGAPNPNPRKTGAPGRVKVPVGA